MIDFRLDGVAHYPAVLDAKGVARLRKRLDEVLADRPGVRLVDAAWFEDFGADSSVWRIAVGLIGDDAKPVRIVGFDKTPETNWALPWHQDRTIAVRERIEVTGFGPWATKDGIPHVEPPIELLAGMVTLRLHLDDCGTDNAPLQVALGSHALGLIPAAQAASVARALPQRECLALTGDIWACSTLILHRSNRSLIAGRRRVIQVDYVAVDLPGGLLWQFDSLPSKTDGLPNG